MAWDKKAFAKVSHRSFRPENWSNFLDVSPVVRDRQFRLASNSSLTDRAASILGEELRLDKYLLSHCSIVASVDTESVPGIKLGVFDGSLGRKINRKWANFRITSETEKYINNNNDSWDRPVLLKSYPTFIGGHNFQEHIQIESQSKGRIIDAVARDIGDSIFIDILVATHRKHAALVRDIEDGKLSTLSMGCVVTETQCTKCGNVATDEVDLCDCQRYDRGQSFVDENGVEHRVAELCGNKDMDHETCGVRFIEASWVNTPAFTGAVMRNIIVPESVPVSTKKKAKAVLAEPPKEWGKPVSGRTKKATPGVMPLAKMAEGFDFGDMGGEGDSSEEGEEKKEEKSPMDTLEDDVEGYILSRVKEKIQDKIQKKNQQEAIKSPSDNSNLLKEAAEYKISVKTAMKIASSDAQFINNLALLNEDYGIRLGKDLYRTVLSVGSPRKFQTRTAYLTACQRVLSRRVSRKEAKNLLLLGQALGLYLEGGNPV